MDIFEGKAGLQVEMVCAIRWGTCSNLEHVSCSCMTTGPRILLMNTDTAMLVQHWDECPELLSGTSEIVTKLRRHDSSFRQRLGDLRSDWDTYYSDFNASSYFKPSESTDSQPVRSKSKV